MICINESAELAPLCFFLSPSAWGDCYCWPLLSQQCWLQACLRLRSPSPAQRRTRRRHPRWQSTLSTITTTAATSSVSRTSSLPKQRKRWVQLKEEKHSQGCVEEKVIFTKIFLLLLLFWWNQLQWFTIFSNIVVEFWVFMTKTRNVYACTKVNLPSSSFFIWRATLSVSYFWSCL